MTYALFTEVLAQLIDRVMTGHARGLIDENKAVHHRRTTPGHYLLFVSVVVGIRSDRRRVGLFAQQLFNACCATNDFVWLERENRCLSSVHLAVDRSLQTRAMLTECFDNSLVSFFSEHGVEIHDGSVHLWVNIDRGDGEELKPLVLNTNEVFSDDFA